MIHVFARPVCTTLFVAMLATLFIAAPQTQAELKGSAATAVARSALPRGSVTDFGNPPSVSTGPLSPEIQEALDTAFGNLIETGWDTPQDQALHTLAESEDARLAWLIVDQMRFVTNFRLNRELAISADKLLGTSLAGFDAWHKLTDRLIAWDIPAPPDYLKYKRKIYVDVLPAWAPLFQEGDIDWRHVAWGGVRIDDREFDRTDTPCNCIPAADNPEVVTAANANWLADDAVVFGIEVNGEYRAYPRQIMEVREMVNDSLGGRNLGIPYCTLCGSAQAWFTDGLPEGVSRPILRTSGLLIRSNKVMYDLTTHSVFDTFKGQAVTGPLAAQGIKLKQAAVVTTTWGKWKRAHPTTTVLIEALALGRDFDFRNNRDANGPIFPIGDTDPRLAVHEEILGIVTESGQPLAFHVPSVISALDAGESVAIDDVRIVLDAGGVRAVSRSGDALGTHQSFWFAWSQFYPKTRLWPE